MPTDPQNPADIQIENPSIIIEPVVNGSQIEILTTNVVNIINDLASGLATGSLPTGVNGEPDQEFRVQYAYEAKRALNLVGKFRREKAGLVEGEIDTTIKSISAEDFDALITARIKEYISKITINDGSGFEAGRDAAAGDPRVSIPQDPNTIVNEQLRKDLTGYYKEQILQWVSDVFMNEDNSAGIKAGIDSLKELVDFLNAPNSAGATGLLNRVGILENEMDAAEARLKALDYRPLNAMDSTPKGRVTAIEDNIGSFIEYSKQDVPDDHEPLTVRESIAKEIRDRKTDVENLWAEVGTDLDAVNANTLRGNHAKLKADFETEKANSDANDTLIATSLTTSNTQITAINNQLSQIGTITSFTNATAKIAAVRSEVIAKFKTAAQSR
jgi:hypothetical protein